MVRGKGSRLLSALDEAERSVLLGALLRRHRPALAQGSVLACAGQGAVGGLAEEVPAVLAEQDLPVPDLPEPGRGR